MQPETDRDLLHRWSQGDDLAFATLVNRHHKMVLAVARRVTCDHHAAEDVAQATFLILARKAAALSAERSDLGGWLHHVTRGLARDRRANEAVRRRHEGATMNAEPSAKPSVDATLAAELSAHLDDALACLPDRQRQCLVLHHLEGLPVALVAERLAVAEGNVCQWLSRGRERLRRLLERRGVAVSSGLLLIFLCDDSLRCAEGVAITGQAASPASQALVNAYLRHQARVRLAWTAGVSAIAAAAILAVGATFLFQPQPPAAHIPSAAIPETTSMSNRTTALLAAAALATAPAIVSAADAPTVHDGSMSTTMTVTPSNAVKAVIITMGQDNSLAHVVADLTKAGCQVSLSPDLAGLQVPFPDSGKYAGEPGAVLQQIVAATATRAHQQIEVNLKGVSDANAGVWVVEPARANPKTP